jgi:uncharacterized MAPEG superfamily protein
MENLPLFVGAMVLATQAGVSPITSNTTAAIYTAVRITYALLYIYTESMNLSWLRTICWWTGNIQCIRLLLLASKTLNGSK